ncbi:MAG TPA: hypothetical protein VIM30_02335 [Candidatus Limnocylindrales bacterium]|jgi:hypothetical protein
MNGRNGFRLIAGVVLVLLLAVAGAGLYQAGISQGVAQTAVEAGGTAAPAVAPYAYYGLHPFGFGFGIFGFLLFLFFLFLIFRLIGAVVWGGRRGGYWGGGRWGHHGYGPGYGPGGPGGFRGSPWEDRAREVHDEWHRRQGGESAAPNAGSTNAAGSNAGGSDGGSPTGSSSNPSLERSTSRD